MGIPYIKGSETSKAAAESVKHLVGSNKVKIYQYLINCGNFGATDDEIEAALSMKHARPRRRDLEEIGAVERTTTKRVTRSGREAFVYVAIPGADLKATRGRPQRTPEGKRSMKATTYLLQDDYADLCMLAAEQDVSVADLIRTAIKQFVSNQ